jgi:hypothetical protein
MYLHTYLCTYLHTLIHNIRWIILFQVEYFDQGDPCPQKRSSTCQKAERFFVNAQNTINSVRETVSQRVMNSRLRQYYIRSQLSRLSPSLLFDI